MILGTMVYQKIVCAEMNVISCANSDYRLLIEWARSYYISPTTTNACQELNPKTRPDDVKRGVERMCFGKQICQIFMSDVCKDVSCQLIKIGFACVHSESNPYLNFLIFQIISIWLGLH